MEAIITLAGGFYGIANKSEIWGYSPVESLGDKDRGVDFVVKIKGIPPEFLAPEGVKVTYKWYCEKCQRVVPEWEMERRVGCANHDPKPEKMERPEWRTGVLEAYKIPRLNIDTIRIWLDSTPGRERWRDIVRYVKATYPATKSLSNVTPKPIGIGNEFVITEATIPFIDLTNFDMSKTPREEVDELKNELKDQISEVKKIKSMYETRLKKEGKQVQSFKFKIYKCRFCGKELKGYQTWWIHEKNHKKRGDTVQEYKPQKDTKDVGSAKHDNPSTSS